MESQNYKRLSPQSTTSAKRDSLIAMRPKAKPSSNFVNVYGTHSANALRNFKHTGISKFGPLTRPTSRDASQSLQA
jgi:hypothetical protein